MIVGVPKEIKPHEYRVALALGAEVTVLDVKRDRLCCLEETTGGRLKTLISNPYVLKRVVPRADLLIGAVLTPGARAPRMITEEMAWKCCSPQMALG